MIKGPALLLVGIMLTVFAGCGSSTTPRRAALNVRAIVGGSDSEYCGNNGTGSCRPYGVNSRSTDYGMGFDPSDKSLAEGDTLENNQYTRYIADNLNIGVKLAWQAANGNVTTRK